ncbi:2Fe-2S iron-sulfur cluster binding domain-containing protein [candidate division KSB1 bacterium]|nr:2Fe-2S iron-sulfur cluster binding domain-containing protein [candidate division KSB1 bacterium]
MEIQAHIYRYHPEKDEQGQVKSYSVKMEPGMSVLELLHQVHAKHDGTLAYRYSCRGAICGTCAVKINDVAGLACKTQVADVVVDGAIKLEPLTHLGVVKDLVVDQRPFWDAVKATMPWLNREKDIADEKMTYEDKLNKHQLDQLSRSSDCIKCASCYSDCPKVDEMPEFIGPAISVQVYKQMFDPRDTALNTRIEYANAECGVFACDKHATCVKVCPKDCRPLRAITFIQNKIKEQQAV